MSVSPNTGDASLNSIADQINRLERDPNATPEYDNALDAWFAAIEAQRLDSGDGKTTSTSGSDDPAAAGSGGGGSSAMR